MSLADLRQEYALRGLSEEDLQANPVEQFQTWFAQAIAAGLPEPNAMTLATTTPDGRPSARVVLLKALDERGFVFFTNYASRKGGELAANPYAALVFFWPELQRQVRIEGPVERVTAEESDGYFASRPLGSRIGAWASSQSQVIESREELERRAAELAAQYPDGEVPRPPHWGGLRVRHERVEFWQGRPSRLHDRLRYTKRQNGWRIERLAP